MKRNTLIIILFVALLGFSSFFMASSRVFAKPLLDSLFHTDSQDSVKFVPNVTIPGSEFQAGVSGNIEVKNQEVQGNLAGKYIVALYKFFVGIAGIVAVIMIAIGGFVWLFSGGSPDKISKAKEIIFGAVAGLLLAVGSYLILYTINPQLVNFNLAIPLVTDLGASSSEYCPYQAFVDAGAERFYGNCGQRFNQNITGLTDYYGCTFAKCGIDQICVKDGLINTCKSKFELTKKKIDSENEIFLVSANASLLIDSVKTEAGITSGEKYQSCGLVIYNEDGATGQKNGWIENFCACDRKGGDARKVSFCVTENKNGTCSPLSAKMGVNNVCRDTSAQCACEGTAGSIATCNFVTNTKGNCTGVIDVTSNSLTISGSNVVMAMQPDAANDLIELAQAAKIDDGVNNPIIENSLAINDMFRGPGVQEYLQCKTPSLANNPGQSTHELGLAFDIDFQKSGIIQAEYNKFLDLAAQYNYFPAATGWGVDESWHFTHQGGITDLNQICPST